MVGAQFFFLSQGCQELPFHPSPLIQPLGQPVAPEEDIYGQHFLQFYVAGIECGDHPGDDGIGRIVFLAEFLVVEQEFSVLIEAVQGNHVQVSFFQDSSLSVSFVRLQDFRGMQNHFTEAVHFLQEFFRICQEQVF